MWVTRVRPFSGPQSWELGLSTALASVLLHSAGSSTVTLDLNVCACVCTCVCVGECVLSFSICCEDIQVDWNHCSPCCLGESAPKKNVPLSAFNDDTLLFGIKHSAEIGSQLKGWGDSSDPSPPTQFPIAEIIFCHATLGVVGMCVCVCVCVMVCARTLCHPLTLSAPHPACLHVGEQRDESAVKATFVRDCATTQTSNQVFCASTSHTALQARDIPTHCRRL